MPTRREQKLSNIPDGWEVQQDEVNIYYYCHATGESSGVSRSTAPLPPPPWEMNSHEDGSVYFYNTITGESRWDLKGLDGFNKQ